MRRDTPSAVTHAGKESGRWGRDVVLAATLLVAMLVSTFPQYSIGVLAPVLTNELDMGEAVLGIVAATFYIAAATVARVAGRAFDVIGGRPALGLLFAGSMAALLLLAASRSVAWLLVASIVGGMAMGTNNPITNRIIAVSVPAGRRGPVIGVKQTGVKVSHLASGVVIPWLTLTIGWRPGLVVIAAITGMALLAVVIAVPENQIPSDGADLPPPAADRHRMQWLRHFAIAMAIGMSAINTYLPLYAVERVGMSLTQAGLAVTVFALTATVARLGWAAIAERIGNPTGSLLALSAGAASGVALLALAEPIGSWLLWVAAVWTGATAGSWNVVAQLTVVSEVDAARTASATGLVQSAFLAGLAIGSPLFGSLVEITGSFQFAWLVAAALASSAFVVALRERRRRGWVAGAEVS